MAFTPFDEAAMRRALEVAALGRGFVEPNPQVGAVVAAGGEVVAEGWHARFGGPHAEAVALSAAGGRARNGTLYVTLEPCCHHGKTPPCTDAITAAGIARVVVATGDPFPEVAGRGIAALRAAGITVETGLFAGEAERLVAPFRTLLEKRRPWVIAKWAMSLDGRLSPPPGRDRWISSPDSRAAVHDLRTRVDAILVGIGTALADDPLLTPRPVDGSAAGPRTPVRIVLDGDARLPTESRLVRTARDAPLLVAAGPGAAAHRIAALERSGCEVWREADPDPAVRLRGLLGELGRRNLTNLLVEGGPTVLGGMLAAGLVDEIWAFIAPSILGGPAPSTPPLDDAARLTIESVSFPGGDILVRGIVR